MSRRAWEIELREAVRSVARLDPRAEAEFQRRHEASGVWNWLTRQEVVRRAAFGVLLVASVVGGCMVLTMSAMAGYASWRRPPFESNDLEQWRSPLAAFAVQAMWLVWLIPAGLLVVAPRPEFSVQCYLPVDNPSRRAPWQLAWLAIPVALLTIAGWWPLAETLQRECDVGQWMALGALFAIQLAFIPSLAVVWLGIWRGPWGLVLAWQILWLLFAAPAGLSMPSDSPWIASLLAALPTGWVLGAAWWGVVEGQGVAWSFLLPIGAVIAIAVRWLARGLKVDEIEPGAARSVASITYRFGWARNRFAAPRTRRPPRRERDASSGGKTESITELAMEVAARERLAALANSPGLVARPSLVDRWCAAWYGGRDRDIQRGLSVSGGDVDRFARTHAIAALLVVGGSEISWLANPNSSRLPPDAWGPPALSCLLLVPYLVAYITPLIWRGPPPEAIASGRRAWRYSPFSRSEAFRAEWRCSAARVVATLPVTLGLACAGVAVLGISWHFALDCALRAPLLIMLWAPLRAAIATEPPTRPNSLLDANSWRRIGVLLLVLSLSAAFFVCPPLALRGVGRLSCVGLPVLAWGLAWLGKQIEGQDALD